MNKPDAGLLNRQRDAAFPPGTAEIGYFLTNLPMRIGKSDVFGGNEMNQPSKPRLSAYVRGEIGGWLRAVHEEILKEGIPAPFATLLKRLDREEPAPIDRR